MTAQNSAQVAQQLGSEVAQQQLQSFQQPPKVFMQETSVSVKKGVSPPVNPSELSQSELKALVLRLRKRVSELLSPASLKKDAYY